jgi:hypothetical protein
MGLNPRAPACHPLQPKPKTDAELATEKYGLEAGLFKVRSGACMPSHAGRARGKRQHGRASHPLPPP